MELSIFLAKAFGLYLVIVSIACIFNYERLQPAVNSLVKNDAMLMLAAFLSLILGIILVLVHNVWVRDWPVLITLLAWLTLIQGIVRFYFPAIVQKMTLSLQSKRSYLLMGVISFLIGLFLLYHGFYLMH